MRAYWGVLRVQRDPVIGVFRAVNKKGTTGFFYGAWVSDTSDVAWDLAEYMSVRHLNP